MKNSFCMELAATALAFSVTGAGVEAFVPYVPCARGAGTVRGNLNKAHDPMGIVQLSPREDVMGRARSTTRMTLSSDKAAQGLSNAGALGVGVACAVGASTIAEISPHAAAFVQLVCLSVWLGMSLYATFLWPLIAGLNIEDSSEFANLLGKLGPSYLQLSAAMIMSLATSSVVIGHVNDVQLGILGVALAITLYNVTFLEPQAVEVLEEEQEAERRFGTKTKAPARRGKQADDVLPAKRAKLANFLGAEVLLDLLAIICALAYAWDLASSITFS